MLRSAFCYTIPSSFVLSAVAYDDLAVLSDEFDSAHSVTNWQRIHQVEGWSNDDLD